MLPQCWTDENDGKPCFMKAILVYQLAWDGRSTLLQAPGDGENRRVALCDKVQ